MLPLTLKVTLKWDKMSCVRTVFGAWFAFFKGLQACLPVFRDSFKRCPRTTRYLGTTAVYVLRLQKLLVFNTTPNVKSHILYYQLMTSVNQLTHTCGLIRCNGFFKPKGGSRQQNCIESHSAPPIGTKGWSGLSTLSPPSRRPCCLCDSAVQQQVVKYSQLNAAQIPHRNPATRSRFLYYRRQCKRIFFPPEDFAKSIMPLLCNVSTSCNTTLLSYHFTLRALSMFLYSALRLFSMHVT